MIDVHCPGGGRHEFGVSYSLDLDEVGFFVTCKKCDDVILDGPKEIIPKLNAAMQLTADEAQAAINSLPPNYMPELRHYRDAWRGDTEESE